MSVTPNHQRWTNLFTLLDASKNGLIGAGDVPFFTTVFFFFFFFLILFKSLASYSHLFPKDATKAWHFVGCPSNCHHNCRQWRVSLHKKLKNLM
jgi:hypothetical protein